MVAEQLRRGEDFFRIAEYALLLLVAAIPAAMPAVLSMTMAMGAKALAVEKAIGVEARHLIKELAGISILFSDKTGTLTQNKLTLGEPHVWAAPRPTTSFSPRRWRRTGSSGTAPAPTCPVQARPPWERNPLSLPRGRHAGPATVFAGRAGATIPSRQTARRRRRSSLEPSASASGSCTSKMPCDTIVAAVEFDVLGNSTELARAVKESVPPPPVSVLYRRAPPP